MKTKRPRNVLDAVQNGTEGSFKGGGGFREGAEKLSQKMDVSLNMLVRKNRRGVTKSETGKKKRIGGKLRE